MAEHRRSSVCLMPLAHLLLLITLFSVSSSSDPGIAPETTRSVGGNSSTWVKPARFYQSAEFVTPYANSSFTRLAVSEETHEVFVGAVNYLYSLDEELNKNQEVKTGPALDSPRCPPPADEPRTCAYQQYTDNVNKVLVIDELGDRLIACGTLYHGYCERRHLANISILEPPDFRSSVVTSNASASTVAFIAPGPTSSAGIEQKRVLYVSVSWSKPEGILEDIPALSSRKLDDFTLAFKDSLKFTSTSFNFEGQQRPQFPVKYVYGFSSQEFSYMLTVQKKQPGPENVAYHSVAVRVCQSDVNYYSYMEVPLVCSFGDKNENNTYPILVAAHLGNAGRNLALQLGVNVKTDVLFAVFARVENHSMEPKAEALCLFNMDTVRDKFTENIVRCFNGEGFSGGGHLGSVKECTKHAYYGISEYYCGDTDSNQPIFGTIPIVSQPVLTFGADSPRLSSVIAATTHDYTVAFLGTKQGQLIKVSVDSNSSTNIYETVSVADGLPIQAGMSFDDDMKHLYILTEKKVVKMKVQNCAQYLTCSECLGARDPYCGWCSLENNRYGNKANMCSQRSECQGSDMSKRWLPYDSQECPRIKKIIPDQIQKDKERLLTLDIQHFPDFQIAASYKCVFTSLSSPDQSNLTTLANRTSNSLQCYTPSTALLPPFEKGTDSVDMELFVLMNDKELVHETVTFFDCGIHTSCTSCTLSQFSCTWCVNNNLCTDNSDRYCYTDVLITGINKSGTSTTPGPKYCPRIESNPSNEILIPAGSKKSITVRGLSLQSFQLNNLRCQFNSVIEVEAKFTLLQDNDYLITCKDYEFDYIRDADYQHISLRVLWGDRENSLDNPSGILVITTSATTTADTTNTTEASKTVRQDFECHLNYMHVFIPVELVPNSQLTLRELNCRLLNNGTHHKISFDYDECGTSQSFFEDYISIDNEVNVHNILNNTAEITFVEDYTIPLKCLVDRSKHVNGAIQVISRESIHENAVQSTDFHMKEFTTKDYDLEITAYPIQLPINREIFFEVALTNSSSNSTGIFVEKCEATPSIHRNGTVRVSLVNFGCSVNPAVKVLPVPEIDRFRFSIQAFHFSGPENVDNMVYVHCSASTCGGVMCDNTCPKSSRRRRRSTRGQASATLTSGSHVVG